jgi:hypothetical protein
MGTQFMSSEDIALLLLRPPLVMGLALVDSCWACRCFEAAISPVCGRAFSEQGEGGGGR